MATPTKPVRRYDVDGNPLRTGHHVGSLAHTRPHADERVEAATAYIESQRALDNEDKDLTARFKEAFDESSAGAGATDLLEQAEDEFAKGILGIKQRAAANVAASQMTKEQKLGQAVADALIDRGVVPEPPSPDIGELDPMEIDEWDEYEPDEPEAETLHGWFDEVEQVWYQTDGTGYFERDENGNYITYPAASVVNEDELADGEEIVGWMEADDAA